jgi:hypothetical protein
MKMRKEKAKGTKRSIMSPIAALAFVSVFAWHDARAAGKASWHDYCREYVFNEKAWPWEKDPTPDAANQKPWLSYCEGYLEGLFDAWVVAGVICLPEGTRNYQVMGSVVVLFDKSNEKDRQMPGLIAMNAWLDAFPCKRDKR